MDVGYKIKLENPKKKANFFSLLVFGWVMPLLYKGTREGIQINDLYKALENDKSKKLGDELEKNWNDEIHRAKGKNAKPSLLRALSKTFLFGYMMWGILFFLQMAILRSIQPIVLSKLITLFIVPDADDRLFEMYSYSALVVGLNAFTIFMLHHNNFGFSVIGMRMRVALSSLIYRKITRLNQKSLGKTAAGQIINLLSNDVNRFDLVILALHTLWTMPIQLVLISYFLWKEVGISCLAGISTMLIISLPFQGYLGKLTGQLRSKIAHKTDKRVKLMNEIISGIQVIKMYTWEKPFEKMVNLARTTEVKDLTTTSYVRGIFSSCHILIQRSTLCLTIICYVLLGNVLTADVVFTIAQFYSILQLSMSILYPMAISLGAEAWVSIKRLHDFMMLEERHIFNIEELEVNGIQMTNVSSCWTENEETLKDISLEIPPGTLCAVVGSVGSGKSSLLQVLLGELSVKSGKVAIGGQISYSSQEPWLFHSTVRSNILFGLPYNKSWYRKVVSVCALRKDFEKLPEKDKTMVGERGVSLSGGQKSRINLARAIYRQADVYLMDDPLSAVDAHVGKHLFDKCIVKHLRGKTRILVTHQLQYLKKADLIIVINEGRIEAQGTYGELSDSNLDFTKMLVATDESDQSDTFEKTGDNKYERLEEIGSTAKDSVISLSSNFFTDSLDFVHHNPKEETESDPNVSAFWEYVRAMNSWCLVLIVTVLLFLAQSASTGADYWVAYWTDQEQIRNSNGTILNRPYHTEDITVEIPSIGGQNILSNIYTYSSRIQNFTVKHRFSFDDLYDTVQLNNTTYKILKTNYAMYFYGALVVAAILLTIARSLLMFKLCMRASKNLHWNMFHVLLKAPMSFFDRNPTGKILNRFSKDMGSIDETLPRVFMDAIQITLIMFGILVNVGVSNPYMVVSMILIGSVFWTLRGCYLATAKVIKHIEGATKSPVFSHVTSTLNGIPTIRSAKAENVLISQFDEHQDVHTSAWFLTIACMTFFGMWLDIVCLMFIGCVTFSFVVLQNYSAVTGSFVGLAITQSLNLSGLLQHGIRRTADVINELTSVERILQYTTIESEYSTEVFKDKSPPPTWPQMGQIEFCDLSLRYVDNTPVLKSLDFIIKPGEKIGIVGRTGAGKSSLISALFRLTSTDGSIFIDGLDTKEIGLRDLRKAISIIPQEPVLFAATMRYNLDPSDQFDDFKLWKALEEVELKDSIDSLNCMVSEGGCNFSLGQRQLVCLARAILRNNKILIMDEATANVDPRTDSLIQTTIRKKFKDRTVLTIAHRLNTIMDSDKVLVMSYGNLVEFDHPHKLLQIPNGYFHNMVLETGQVMSLQLKDIALEAYNEKIKKGSH